MPIWSYVRSTDFDRKPWGKNVLWGVDISVMVCATIRAVPFTNIQRPFFNYVTTLAASLRTRKPSLNLDQGATVPVRGWDDGGELIDVPRHQVQGRNLGL
jgi:hypothetical protein